MRCITPGTLVIQTVSGEELAPLASFDGPAIAAIMPAGAAEFVHDPRGGRGIMATPGAGQLPDAPKKAVGGSSAWQMAEDLRLLKDLARTPFVVPTRDGPGVPAMGTGQAVDQLAAWLLGETGLPGGA